MKVSGVPTFANVARLIAPSNTPPWLAELLHDYGLQIAKERELQELFPYKKDLRTKLLEAKQAVERITSLLNDAMTMVFVEAESNIKIKNIVELKNNLKELVKAVELAAASPAISGPEGKTKKGAGKAMARTTLLPKTFCALVVAESWLAVRRRRSALRNKEAAAAAHASRLVALRPRKHARGFG